MYSKKDLYIAFLQASSIRYSCNALSDVTPIETSHDVFSKWLKNKTLKPSEVWSEAKNHINDDQPSVLIADDTIIDKRHSKKIEPVRYLYSGNAHDIIPGIAMTNLVWHGIESKTTVPVDFRMYAPQEDGKTKNDHFREMVKNAISRGIKPDAVLADTWYSSLDNLKMLRDSNINWVMGLKKNRKVNRKEELQNLDIPEQGLRVHLRGYGWITVYRFVAKSGRTDYIGTNIESTTRSQILSYVKMRWNIETYHRELKQTCGLERCQARSSRAQRNHIVLSVLSWMQYFKRRCLDGTSYYTQKWESIKPAISNNIQLLLNA